MIGNGASWTKRFASTSSFTKIWAPLAFCLLGLSRFLVLTVPYSVLSRFLGTGMGVAPSVFLLSPQEERRARQVARVIAIAAPMTPWKSNCYAQALTARLLLSIWGIPCSLFFGLALVSDSMLKAHAWVSAGRVCVTGGDGSKDFAVVNSFVAGQSSLPLPPWGTES